MILRCFSKYNSIGLGGTSTFLQKHSPTDSRNKKKTCSPCSNSHIPKSVFKPLRATFVKRSQNFQTQKYIKEYDY